MQDDAFVFVSRHSGALGGVASENPDAPQLVIGSKGTDTLVGGPQDDTLVAAPGDQTLTGLAGSDQFVFSPHSPDERLNWPAPILFEL